MDIMDVTKNASYTISDILKESISNGWIEIWETL